MVIIMSCAAKSPQTMLKMQIPSQNGRLTEEEKSGAENLSL